MTSTPEFSYLGGSSSIPNYGMTPSPLVKSLRKPPGYGGPRGIQPLTPQFIGAPLTGGPTMENAEAMFGAPMAPPMSDLAPDTSLRPPQKPDIADPTKAGNGFFGADGFNIGDVGTIADVIGTFGSIWGGIQANKIAKEEMALQKQAYQTNLASSISSYNLAIEDRMRARYAQNERSDAEASAYIAANQLKA